MLATEQRDKLRSTLPGILAVGLAATAPHPPTTLKWMANIYLLQQAFQTPLGYRFTLYTYGPQAPEVQADLDHAKLKELVHVVYDQGLNSYVVIPGPKVNIGTDEIQGAWQPHMPSVRALLRSFGHLTPSQTRLLASAHFIASNPGQQPLSPRTLSNLSKSCTRNTPLMR